MTAPDGDLVSEEGVDQGSAAMSTEGDAGPDLDAVGTGTQGGPDTEEQPAGPDPVDTLASRRAKEGQQLAAGEG